MPRADGTVLVVEARDPRGRAVRAHGLAQAAHGELRDAGLDAQRVEARDVLAEAGRRSPSALVLVTPVSGRLWSRWRADPRLRNVPLVIVARGDPKKVLFPWPIGALVRGDAFVSAAALAERGALAAAVRAAARPRQAPTSAQRRAEVVWYAGSVLFNLALAVALGGLAWLASGGGPSPVLVAAILLGSGKLLLDVAGPAAVGHPRGLRFTDAIIVAWVAASAWALAMQ